jgi:protein ImuB
MLWLSLIPCSAESQPLAWWALQYTPRVACREGAVLLEVASSLQLFGGAAALRAHMRRQLEQGLAPAFTALACAPTSLGALALSRYGLATQERPAQPARGGLDGDGPSRPLAAALDALPLHTISAVEAQAQTLARLGCRTLGDVRGLPRAGLARRFGAPLVAALDQAYGLQPEAHDWVTLPDVFDERLELPWRVDSAPALMHGAQHLLQRLQAWLAARHAGVRAVVLRWQHEFGARAAGAGGELVVRTAQPARRVDHLARLVAEHLAQTTLLAPVGELALRATEIEPLAPPVLSLLPPDGRGELGDEAGEGWQAVAERLSVRLGAAHVLRAVLHGDHRPGHMQSWVPVCPERASQGVVRAEEPRAPYHVPQPSWLLDEPRPLAVRDECPQYQGPLRLLAGPHRVESGWWDDASGEGVTGGAMARDYFVAASPRAGLLWVFRSRLPRASAAGDGWFLHGIYG